MLITEHTEEGAAGLVLNRRSGTAVADAVPNLAPLVEDEELVYVGGPVQQEAVLCLAEFEDPEDAAILVLDHVGFVPGDGDFGLIAGGTRRARVFAGYAGWGPGQLETELEASSWIVEDATRVDLFADPDADLWGSILHAKGGIYRLIALMPDDPSVN